MKSAIDIMIAGAQKSGTSTLRAYLDQHPTIVSHLNEEFSYFISDREYAQSYPKAVNRYFQGRPFTDLDQQRMAKCAGLMFSEQAITRLYEHNPDVKILIILRNPIDRAYSAYWFARRRGWESAETFAEAIARKTSSPGSLTRQESMTAYLSRGEYISQIQTIEKIFSPDNLHVILFEEFMRNPVAACYPIFDFLNLMNDIDLQEIKAKNSAAIAKSSQVARILDVNRNPVLQVCRNVIPKSLATQMKRSINRLNEQPFKPPRMDPAIRKQLEAYFQPYNHQLEEHLGRSLSLWAGSQVHPAEHTSKKYVND